MQHVFDISTFYPNFVQNTEYHGACRISSAFCKGSFLKFQIYPFVLFKTMSMPVTIAIPPTIEQRLRDDAARQGVSLEDYIAQMLITGFSGSNRQDVTELTEDQLLQRIQLNIHPRELEEYNRLVELQKMESLTEEEYERLLALTNRIEIAHAERMKYVVALAKLRGVTLEQMMLDLGIQKNAA